MSGQITSNVFRGSGVIAATAGGLNWVSTVVTASTLTAEAGNGYWINTTSNTCTITLPSSAAVGDQIVFIDYLRTWGTNKIIIDSNGLNYQGEDDTFTVEYNTDGETLNIVYADATKGWIPLNDDDVTDAPSPPPTQKAIFGYGYAPPTQSITNLVSSSGVVATDTTGVGTARHSLSAAGYGVDKALFGFGTGPTAITNLVNNSGVVATDTAGVGTARRDLAATTYGTDKAIFGFGEGSGPGTNITNLVSNSGVVATDTAGVGTARYNPAATGYGPLNGGKALFGYGYNSSHAAVSMTNHVSNVGVVGSDVTGVGTARRDANGGARYGGDKAIIAYGYGGGELNISNLISNTGVVATDTSGVGTARSYLAAANYGGDKAIFGYGGGGGEHSMTNLVTNLGVVGADVTGVGTSRGYLAAAGYSTSA